ncbi:hypothetical protein LOSG293_070130 [Secundilactobacillus oryzae JCM 18671]|uniref:Uncharacterized protein n=1 Tax=Secundilactobacillus oryzae JCM 18671 TaxID=1291743 RepID=A0A081BHF6_9LACO|nr:hypothetical protein [Secundilactobacillus oryzae]GAK47474.1 hypothetical protein LOSG293_070130 [Secundilactobacillus oryzae JCM 18671]
MAMTTNREQLELVKQRISEANQKSHFVIFKSVEHGKQATLRLITDYDSFQIIKKAHQDQAEMTIAQDIVPITDNLARWALAENAAATNPSDPEVLQELEICTNDVLRENRLRTNEL